MAESDSTSTQGWSDVQWNPSPPSTRPSDDSSHRDTLSDNKLPIPRPIIKTSVSPFFESKQNIHDSPVVLEMDSGVGNGYAHYHQSDPYNAPRSRRKSVGASLALSEDEEELLSGSGSGKKRRRGRGSFSLPFHGGRRRIQPSGWFTLPQILRRRRSKCLLIFALLAALVYGFVLWKRTYEIQLEFSIFSRKWIAEEIDSIQPLKGCFHNPSPRYNMTQHVSPRRHMLSTGTSLKRGMSCYDFASTIKPEPEAALEHVYYHTYWRSDLISFGERQSATFLAFLATQPLTHSTLIVWTNGAESLSQNPHIVPFLERWGEYIQIRQVNLGQLAQGTGVEDVIQGITGEKGIYDERAWVDGDAVRLLVLWNYGGIWMDMDQLLTRDLHPLTEEEWVTQWDCYDKPYFSLNGALMHFHAGSPYLCEAFNIMSTSPLPKPNTFTWGSHLYAKLHRHLTAAGVRPFAVLPWCFSDPRNCRLDNRFPDPFLPDPESFVGKKWEDGEGGKSGRQALEERTSHIYTIHLHNQWSKKFPEGGWIDRLLEGYKAQVNRVERYAESAGLVKGGKVALADK
ncbi:hypothetical protein IAR50_000632 [Cryptococcus sp. DSM 104548]